MGEVIKIFRKRLKLSQTKLGKLVGVNTSSISRWEQGQEAEEMKVKHLRKIAEAINTDTSELLEICKSEHSQKNGSKAGKAKLTDEYADPEEYTNFF